MPVTRPDQRRSPSPRALRRLLPRALPAITEYLAGALSGENKPEPAWSEVEWRIARAVAVIHGISPLLSKRLLWDGPCGWRAFLDSQRAHTASRYGRMAALLAKVEELAVKGNFGYLPLKGEALHALGLYAAGERPMADIDLLVQDSALLPMSAALAALGYRPLSVAAHEHVLVPIDRPPPSHLGEHAEQGITIELHTRIDRPMPVRVVDITAQLWPAVRRSGRNEYRSLAALMGHLLMHAAVNMQLRILRMLQLHDIALLAPRLSAADWNDVLAGGDGRNSTWWVMPPLQLTEHYYPGAIPEAVMHSARQECSPLLRFVATGFRLSDVSASNSRRSLFPALAWTGSLPEAVACIGHRLQCGIQAMRGSPSIGTATELQPWITRSHRRRLLEVLLGRPRPETLLVVEAALYGDPSPGPVQLRPKAA